MRRFWVWIVRRPWAVDKAAALASMLAGFGVDAAQELAFGKHSGAGATPQWRELWVGFVGAAVVYAAVVIARWGRKRMLERTGTAFVILEKSKEWDADQPEPSAVDPADDFYEQVPHRFDRVVNVPGPVKQREDDGFGWNWMLDEKEAASWDDRLMELVHAFRVLYVSASARTSAVFVTAWAPVALAFGLRSRDMYRKLRLHVWQRPSDGRAEEVRPAIWKQRGHLFGARVAKPSDFPEPVGLERSTPVWDATLTVHRTRSGLEETRSVALLLLRFGWSRWGNLPAPKKETTYTVSQTIHDMDGVVPVNETVPARIHELRLLPKGKQFDWKDFPFLVAEAVQWIGEKADELKDQTLLLGSAVPNEVALGIGLTAGQDACEDWPEHLWPIVFQKETKNMVVPRLDLGTDWPRSRE